MDVITSTKRPLTDIKYSKKVLMIAPEPYFEPRGTPISIMQRIRALSELGYQVDLLTYPFGQDVNFPGLAIYRIPRIGTISEIKIGPSGAKLLFDLMLVLRAIWMLSTRRYDVIHSHEEASFFAMILSGIFRVPHLYDMHSSLPNQLTNYSYGRIKPVVGIFRILERAVLKSAAAVITIDADLDQHARDVNPNVNQIQISNLPVYESVTPTTPDKVEELKRTLGIVGKIPVVYTGTLESYQGIELIIQSASQVRISVPDIVYVIVGGRKCQVEHYKSLARDSGVEDIFIFTGNVLPVEASAYLSIAHMVVSMRQGNTSVPLKIYSYLHSHKPILATRTQAHLGILHDEVALLVEPTPNAFAEGTCRLVFDVELRERLICDAEKFAATMQKDTEYVHKVCYIYSTLELPLRKRAEVFEEV